ncbi:Zn-dependent peptidase ImmA (M78 family) [Chitinophaga polysaccharea]|uniref:Zn-dependent peptidase ImmA (M78 family) n=1 Tax=Chitinophaga polysaccharea TaxID=1293035 RepID=A0A561PNC2_9BACT|nr:MULTISPECIES: XRE family transcriptional regulator [Chitinophaga]TWF39590.1 Zn-dependent peptidase ImmA (M78 family) [Chitinophaga polysaccharea]WPV65916.1 XRE family transcriptional regulator [Chitinophaga sp. LS1]
MQFGDKIKELRLKKGFSIQGLADLVGVSKPAIQQYEDGTITPSNKVLKKISEALGVRVWHFFSAPPQSIKLIEFRDGHTLQDEEKEKNTIRELIVTVAQKYLDLVTIMNERILFDNPVADTEISTNSDVEKAAKKLRKKWKIADSPIDDVTEFLELKGFIILTIERPTGSSGVCGYIEDTSGNIPVIIVNTFDDPEITRKRFTILHELAHLLLRFSSTLTKRDQENMCHYFAAAMLLPDEVLISAIGKDRTSISLIELISLKEAYGISIPAIIIRANNVGIINNITKDNWLQTYNIWRDSQMSLGRYTKSLEKPARIENLITKAIAEKRITWEKAAELTNTPIDKLEQMYRNGMLEIK